ncbi:sigma 54 modulation/S30EA ribosomal C-terminal domain-containing protein [Nocardia seriolae]|nr:sigma 54 modulation/S30EA ribosomal C-terminal domain-containing protein [Nocardia seriolae]QOW36253.1 sigma 54 modulation/S30EA ribosomal C-terminal domain-containing protein [Nocardia seriolae]QUN16241.1 sigma 54 modulation/S30EA ribosomal C-terminal domain-containing protein [Nocardia seriolae]WKY55078.1 sigma 54 modulation/S30EA ribosomal C-terminal domain-containing protein [Nocardia seriolae]WNJ56707.1 sigma 54 modulation/S30EA ribosomal C-terminal domain-containing protein [Nocardia s
MSMLCTEPEHRPATGPAVVVSPHGPVPALEAERVTRAVDTAARRFGITGRVRVRITALDVADGPLLIQINLDASGRAVRTQTVTAGHHNILAAIVRLDQQINAARTPWRPRRWPDPARPPLSTPGPGRIVRHKPVHLHGITPEQAAHELDLSDYDAHMFLDSDTGEDAIVYRAGPSGLKIARQVCGRPPACVSEGGPFTMNPRPVAEIGAAEAHSRICDYGLPFVFFTDPDTGRGQLLYRRYDNDLTLLTPAA